MGASSKRRAEDDEDCDCASFFGYLLTALLALSLYLGLIMCLPDPAPTYSVAIGAVSGLDPATDLRDGRALDPAFNLTVRVDASRRDNGACLNETTSVQVSYLRVPLAVGRAPDLGDGNCAAAGLWRDVDVVARGRGVAVPGFLLDCLAEDMRRGVATFEVALMRPSNGGLFVTTCSVKVGDAATLEAPCEYTSWVKAVQPVPQPAFFSVSAHLPLPGSPT